jgi:hypothetical protein
VKRGNGKSRTMRPVASLALSACVIGAALLAAAVASGSAKAAAGQQKLTIYSVATAAQYIDHADDRQRGTGKNPFTVDAAIPNPNNKGSGPFAGDDTLYSFTLYKDQTKTKKVGTAVYTCHYNFAKHALCDAFYKINGSTLLAAGPVLFTSTTFTLAITGGTNKYFGSNGEVAESSITKNLQRLQFDLLAG